MCHGNAGSGQGIGRAFAHALGEAGASIAVVDINFNHAQIVTEELRSKGINSIALHADVSKKADCAKYLAWLSMLLRIGSVHGPHITMRFMPQLD